MQLTDEEIRKLFRGSGVGVGMVGGFDGWFTIDNDEKELARCAKIERMQCELLSMPYAHWAGQKGYKALYRDNRRVAPSKELRRAAIGYLECGFDLSAVRAKDRRRAVEIEEEFAELKAAFDELLDAFIEEHRLIPTAGKPIEVKSFRLITVLPPSVHPETGAPYRITPMEADAHGIGLNDDGEPFNIDAHDVNAFLDRLRPAGVKKQGNERSDKGGKRGYIDYNGRTFIAAMPEISIDDLLKAKADLATFDANEWLEESDDPSDRSPAVRALLGKLLQGMMQVRKCDADKLGEFHDAAKQLAQLFDAFAERFPDQTSDVVASLEEHGRGYQEKLGYEAGGIVASTIAGNFNFYVPGREPRPDDIPQIYLRAGDEHVAVRQAMEHLVAAGTPFFQRDGTLVRPIMEDGRDALGKVTRTAAFAEIDVSYMVERPLIELRVLGKSEMPTLTNRFTVFYNGNNVRPRGDAARRTILADLDPGMDNPSERRFNSDPVATILADQGRYVADCLTIVRAYIVVGRPKVVDKPMNSFGAWSDSVRSALVWLGMDDPCRTVKYVREDDPEAQQHRALLAGAKAAYGTGKAHAFTTRQLLETACQIDSKGMPEYPGLHEALAGYIKGSNLNPKGVGHLLTKFKHRMDGDLCFSCCEDKKHKSKSGMSKKLSACIERTM